MATNNAVNVGLAGSTGSGSFVGSNSPTLVTPIIGAAAATSINFGGSTLGNYLQSTWTPTITLVGGAGNTVPVYTTNQGVYTRIGNIVFCNVLLTGDGGAEGAGTGQVNIALPVTAAASNVAILYYPIGTALNNATYYELFGTISSGGNTIIIAYAALLSSIVAFTGDNQNNTTRSIQLRWFYEV